MNQVDRKVEQAKKAENSELNLKTVSAMHSLSPDELLTTKELMQFLKVKHPKTIYGLIDKGLPKIVVGHKYRFIKKEIIEHLKENSQGRRAFKSNEKNSAH